MDNTTTAKVMQEELKKGVPIYLICYDGALRVKKVIIHQAEYISVKVTVGKTYTFYPERGHKLEFVNNVYGDWLEKPPLEKGADPLDALTPIQRNALRNICILGTLDIKNFIYCVGVTDLRTEERDAQDIPDAYAVLLHKSAVGGCIVYGWRDDCWYANPNLRWLARHFAEKLNKGQK